MSIFNKATTWTKQGDIGESRAIYEYTKLGYGVSKPLNDSMSYDLIIDIDGQLKKVQVKTTVNKSEFGIFYANLKVSGGNSSRTTTKTRNEDDYDILFVLTNDDECYSIPTEKIIAKSQLALGKKVQEYKM